MKQKLIISEPPFSRFLFSSTRSSWIWLIARLYLGYAWIDASLHKVTNQDWVTSGIAIKKFWERVVVIPEGGRPPISYGWYRSFIQGLIDTEAHTWMGPLIAYGELIVGTALILGAFVGIFAFLGGLMNWSFIMAGSASSNGVLLTLAVLLILAWRVAGHYGLDYILLRKVGVPWKVDDSPTDPTESSRSDQNVSL